MEGWPTGFWRLGGDFRAHLIVVHDLPVVRDTLPLRLLGNGERLGRSMNELAELPQCSWLRQRLMPLMVAQWEELSETLWEETMMYSERKAQYDAWLKKTRGAGLKQGRREGKKEGERTVVRKLLTLRFGELPAPAERRLKKAKLVELERWAERVLTADSLAAIFAD
jgi:hypothetical protein